MQAFAQRPPPHPPQTHNLTTTFVFPVFVWPFNQKMHEFDEKQTGTLIELNI